MIKTNEGHLEVNRSDKKNYRTNTLPPKVNKKYTVAYSIDATYFSSELKELLMGARVSGTEADDNVTINDNEEIEEGLERYELTDEAKRELYDSTDSEISVIDFDVIGTTSRSVMRGKRSDKDNRNEKDQSTKDSIGNRYSREPAEKDESNVNVKVKKFASPAEIKQFFQETTDKQDMHCYNYQNQQPECKQACDCCNNNACGQNYDNYNYYNNRDYPQRNESASYPSYNLTKNSQSRNYGPNFHESKSYQATQQPNPNYTNYKNQQYQDNVERNPEDKQRKAYSYSSPEMQMNRYTKYNQSGQSNEFPQNKQRYAEESNSDVDVYKKTTRKKYKSKQRGCPCCNCNFYDHDEESLCSEHSRSSEYMDLAYQQQGDYPNLVDELEDTITQRNKERVQKTLQHFEMISSGMKEPSPLEINDKPLRYNYEPCPCQKFKSKNQNHPCYCNKGQCQFCDKYCKYQQQQQQQQDKCDQQCRGNCLTNYQQKSGYVEKVVRNMDPNLNESVQKYPKFQNKFNNTHWKYDPRSGEWIKVFDGGYDYDNNYPPLPPPPPNNEQIYENNRGDRRQRHSDYMGMQSSNQMNAMPMQNQENYMHHKKNCMCNNCGVHRENRRY